MEPRQIVAYFRVSTKMQGMDGLGMAAQRASIAAYAERTGSIILASFHEVESARREHLRNRPELVKALGFARRAGAILVIARLDRLTRSVYVTSQLLQSGVEFIACDMPDANKLTIQILAVLAEQESRCISERVKGARAAAVARGQQWPYRKGTRETIRPATAASAKARTIRAHEAYYDLLPLIRSLREQRMTFAAIARVLNDQGHRTQHHRSWQGQTVMRLLQREGFGNLPGPRAPKSKPRREPVGKENDRRQRVERLQRIYASAFNIADADWKKGRSFNGIARTLNELGMLTQRGNPWNGSRVEGVLRRGGALRSTRPPHDFTPEGIARAASVPEKNSVRARRAFSAHVSVLVLRLFAAGDSPADIVGKLDFYRYTSLKDGKPLGLKAVKGILRREGVLL